MNWKIPMTLGEQINQKIVTMMEEMATAQVPGITAPMTRLVFFFKFVKTIERLH